MSGKLLKIPYEKYIELTDTSEKLNNVINKRVKKKIICKSQYYFRYFDNFSRYMTEKDVINTLKKNIKKLKDKNEANNINSSK